MITIEQYQEMASSIIDELPEEFFDKLNNGVIVSEQCLMHEDSSPEAPLYVMGQYTRSRMMGRGIVLYYGSFVNTYGHLSEGEQREELRRVIVHEFRHHMEWRSGTTELEDEDREKLKHYRSHFKK